VKRPLVRLFLILACAAGWLTVLPNLQRGIFLSPDETAVYRSAVQFAQTGSMSIPHPSLKEFPWMHPRSFVTLGESMVPVGFIGMPLILGFLGAVGLTFSFGYITPLLVLGVGLIIWLLNRESSTTTRLLAVLSWLSFPTIILYANRGLFPNLPTMCLTVIGGFMVWQKRTIPRSVIAGICIALALAIRPIDAFWILPWAIFAWRFRQDRKQHQERKYLGSVLIAMSVVAIIVGIVQARTYGSVFNIGYFLRDPMVSQGAIEAIIQPSAQPVTEIQTWLPFGFHPRHVWFNLREYLFGFLWPWVLLVGAAIAISWKKREARPWILLGIWTLGSCAAVYGHGIYQDHVGINVASLGNSFLRYILPATVFIPLAISVVLQKLSDTKQRYAILAGFALVSVTCALGLATAFYDGKEALIESAKTLQSYQSIRVSAHAMFGKQVIVFSDRSDKIFFSPGWDAVTPVPDIKSIARLSATRTDIPVLYFGRPLSEQALADWSAQGFTPRQVMTAGNEALYEMKP